jgi:ABC-type multidrug transport system fused ATPase/permease subunit
MTQQLRDLYATLDQVTRRRLKWAIAGLVAISGFEMLGLVLMLPLMQMFAGASIHVGTLGRIDEALGSPSRGALAAILAGVVFGAFVVKGISTLSFRWWMIGFLNIQAAETADQLVGRYLTAPYELHLRRNSADLVRTSLNAVNDAYMKSVMGVLTVVAEGTTILAVAVVLLVLRPLPALAAIFYFFFVSYGFLRYVRRRAQRASADLVE